MYKTNIMNLINLQNRGDATFMNSENSKTCNPYGLLLNLSYEIDLKKSDKYVALWIRSIYYT